MQLTQFSDYAVRTLIYLGLNRDRLVTIEEIARAYGISESHLTKVVHKLGRIGVAETVRGRHGGLRLSRMPEDVNIGWLIRQTEENLTLVECFDHANSRCPVTGICGFAGMLSDALLAFLGTLDRYSLQDIMPNRDALGARLGVFSDVPVLPHQRRTVATAG